MKVEPDNFFMRVFHPSRTKERKDQLKTDGQASTWQLVNQYANLVRNTSSGTYYARFRVGGKLIWKSLKTKAVSVAATRAGT